MKKNDKTNYEIHFGRLQPLDTSALNELCMYESWLPGLPKVLFFPHANSATEKKAKKRLHAHFMKTFNLSQN